ncbi:MAG: electron transfer flavoprotein subunit beta/FixA family protein [Chloroflexia bacterium]|nr:electron transfer flavoprotein subunit beta/FixA family protein [Chloroflexia bacterium]MDQ3512242.1 electron transfer flavoprotein subunit beta/FixA family protein [Chloroflexota bacterium]
MNIVVLVKQVPDMNAVRIDKGTGQPILSDQRVISSYDEYAVEEALRIKEREGGDVTVICAGPAKVKDALTRALAMGADRAILVAIDDPDGLDTLGLARALADQIATAPFDLVIAGQNSDDYESGQVGPHLAELLDLPLVSSIKELTFEGTTLVAKRDVEDGTQTVATELPALVMAITGLNEPRYPSLKGIMAAKKKPLETVTAAVSGPARLAWTAPVAPERQVAGVLVQDVPAGEAADRLVSWLGEHKLLP